MTPVSSMLLHSPAYGKEPVPLVQIIDAMVRECPGLTLWSWRAARDELLDAGHLSETSGPGGPLYARTPLGDAALAAMKEQAA